MPRKRKAPSPTNAAENDNAASGTAAAAAAASKKKKESKEERRQRIAADTLKAKQWAQKRKMGKGTAAAAKGTVASSAKKAKEEKVQGKKKEEKVKEVKVKDDDKEVMSPGRKRGVTVKAKRTTPAKRAAATKSRVTSAKKTAASSNINGNDNDGDDVAIKGDTKTVTAAKEEEEDEKPKAKRARVEPAATGTDNATNTDASTTNSFQQHVATAPSPSVTGNHAMQYPPPSPFQQSAANHMQQHYNAMAQQQLLLQQQQQQQQQRAAYLSSAMMNMQQYEYNQQPHRYNTNTSMSMPTPPPTPVVPAVPTSLAPPPPTTPSSTPQWQQQHQDMPPSVSVSVVQPPIPPPVSSSVPSLPKVSAPVTTNQKEEITTSPITKLQLPIKEDIKHHHPQLQPQLQPPQEEEEEYENDNLQQSSSTISKIVKSTKYMMILSINIIFLFFLFSYFFSSNSSSSSTIYNPSSRSSSSSRETNNQASNNPNNDMPCFKNYGFEKVYQKEIKKQSMNSSNNHEDVIIKTVKEHENYKPNCIHFNNKSTTKNIDYEILTCPKYGRCKNGQLIDCKGYTTTSSATDGDDDTNENDSLFYVPSSTNTYCDISNQSLNSIHELQNLIEQLTIQHVCYNNSCFSSIWNYLFATTTSSTSTSTTTTSTNNENEEDGFLDLKDEDSVKTENYFKRFYQSLNKDQDRMIWKKNMKNSYNNDYDDNDNENDDGVIMFSINVLAKYINLKPNIVEDLIMFVQQEQNDINNNNNNNEKNKSLSKLQIKTIVSPSTTSTTTTTSTWVGLSKQYIEQDLPIPTKCWIRLLFNDLLQSIFSLSIATIYFILNLGWSFILYTNPIYTIGTSLFLYIIVWARMKRNQISKLRLQVSHIQNLAYDKLILDSGGEGGEGYAVLHLRDDIVHELYPNIDDVRRKYFINTIWPKVITAVRMDNRVTKARKNLRGKSLEWWEWVADASRNSRINNSSSSKKMQ